MIDIYVNGKIQESSMGLLKSLIRMRFIRLRATGVAGFFNENFSVLDRLVIEIENLKILEFKTETGFEADFIEYNITEIKQSDELEDFKNFQDFPLSQPFILKKVFIYGQFLEFSHTYSDMGYERIKKLKLDNFGRTVKVQKDTEDILLFENEYGKQFMLWTPESPSFEVIFNKMRIEDILNKKYSGIEEKVFKLKRVIE